VVSSKILAHAFSFIQAACYQAFLQPGDGLVETPALELAATPAKRWPAILPTTNPNGRS